MTYPDGIDALVNVNATDTLAAGGHAARHNSVNTALDEVRDLLNAGDAGKVLTAAGSAAPPVWAAVSAVATWQNWTPTITQSGTVSRTVTRARYAAVGKLTVAEVLLDFTGAGTGNNLISSTLPVTAAGAGSTASGIGSFIFRDTGTAFYVGTVYLVSTTALRFLVHNVGDDLGRAPNFAIASGDALGFTIVYEAA
jgi:hypothetical protein